MKDNHANHFKISNGNKSNVLAFAGMANNSTRKSAKVINFTRASEATTEAIAA